MAPTPTLQALAFHARDFLPKGRSPEDGATSSFEAVVDVYTESLRGSRGESLRARASDAVMRSIVGRNDAPLEMRSRVERFVLGVVRYLAAQYPRVEELTRDRSLLSRLFSAHVREAARVAPPQTDVGAPESVTLRDYMTSRPGEYLVAETQTRIGLEQLDPRIAGLEVEEFVVGVDGNGRRTVHLHAATSHVHILTVLVATPSTYR